MSSNPNNEFTQQPQQPTQYPQQPYQQGAQPGYPPQPGTYPPPYQQQPPKKGGIGKGFAIGCGVLVGLLIICGVIAAMTRGMTPTTASTTNTTTNQTTTQSQDNQTQPTPTPKTSKPRTYSFKGNGEQSTDEFTVGDTWKLTWTCEGGSVGAVFIVDIYTSGSSLPESAVNAQCEPNKTTTGSTTQHKGGKLYLKIYAGVKWTIDIKEQ